MAKEPQVKIIQTTSDLQTQAAKAAQYGIVNPGNSPEGNIGEVVMGQFKVRSSEHPAGRYENFITSNKERFKCEITL